MQDNDSIFENTYDEITKYDKKQSASVKVRPSFREAREIARAQIGLNISGYHKTDVGQFEELALIMTEVYLMDPHMLITISGEQLECYIVQEVFKEINESHAKLVISNFNRTTYMIKNKKAYLRTALYNSVFELASAYANEVAIDFGVSGAIDRDKDQKREVKHGKF